MCLGCVLLSFALKLLLSPTHNWCRLLVSQDTGHSHQHKCALLSGELDDFNESTIDCFPQSGVIGTHGLHSTVGQENFTYHKNCNNPAVAWFSSTIYGRLLARE